MDTGFSAAFNNFQRPAANTIGCVLGTIYRMQNAEGTTRKSAVFQQRSFFQSYPRKATVLTKGLARETKFADYMATLFYRKK